MEALPKTTATPSVIVIRSLTYLAIGMLLPVLSTDLEAADSDGGFKFGDRPPDAVFDPAGILFSKQREEIAAPLARILKDEGIDLLVVILPSIGDAPPKHVAKGFSDEWVTTPINAIVLHVPGNPDSPWIFPGEIISRVVNSEAINESVSEAEKRAAAEPDDFGKVRAASVEAADIMRYRTGGAVIGSESILNERLKRQLEYEHRQRIYKLAAMIGAAGAIPIIAGISLFVARLKKRGPKVFPPVRKISRLGAPYAGGNNAISKIR